MRRLVAFGCRSPRPRHASRRYSLIVPPAGVCLRTRYWSRSTGWGSGFTGAARRAGSGAAGADCGGLRTRAESAADGPGSRRGVTQELAGASLGPAFGDRVHPGRPHVTEHGPDPGADEDGVERGGEVRTAIADHALELMCLAAEAHDQVACLLGGPFPGRVQGDAEDSDAPGRVLNHDKDIGLVPSSRRAVNKSHASIASA